MISLEKFIIEYGLCSVHLDELMEMFPSSDIVPLLHEAFEMVQNKGSLPVGNIFCVMCVVDIYKFVKKDTVCVD